MRHVSTKLAVALLLLAVALPIGLPVQAQPVRNGYDVIWARDVDGAEITMDGVLNEAAWSEAESLDLEWDANAPGTGQWIDGEFTILEPSDPPKATLRLLRDGNTLWLGAEVQDKSVGGATGLWKIDGLVMHILDKARLIENRATSTDPNFFSGGLTEMIYSWWNSADTTDASTTYDDGTVIESGDITNAPLPGISPRFHGFYGSNTTTERDSANVAVWDAVTVVDGISNDDTHGDDAGYTVEMRFDMTAFGYDFTQDGGDKVAWNIGVRDQDYSWPLNADSTINTVVYWQNPWGNNFDYGIAYIMGAPGVTVNSGAVPEVTEPEFSVANGELFDAPAIDGSLDEPVWERVDPSFYVQYKPDQALLDMNPYVARYFMNYWRPDINNDGRAAIVVDPSIAAFKMFFKGNMLYLGVDVGDQAISGVSAEGGMDGIYLFLADQDSVDDRGARYTHRFDFRVDSSGSVVYGSEAETVHNDDATALVAAIGLKGASTVADPTDVDEGYQIEIAMDLTKVLHYPDLTAGKATGATIGDRALYIAMNFLDGDFLETPEDSYVMRTWILTERGGGGHGASIYGYLDPDLVVGTAVEDDNAEIPETIALYGSYPNPFNPSTRISYAIPSAGEVSVQVFSILGQKVAELSPGQQAAGRHDVTFEANGLTSGVYFYRVSLNSQGREILSRADRLVLVK